VACTVNSQCPGGSCGAGYEGDCSGSGPFEQFCGPSATFKSCTFDSDCQPSFNICIGGSNAGFLGCTVGSQCPGGTCEIQVCGATPATAHFRKCFTDNGTPGNNVNAKGRADPPVADTSHPTLVAMFCIGPTSAPAVNAVAGLPGLGRLQLPGLANGMP